MRNVLLQAAIKLNKSRKHRKWWQRAVRVMATVVVFCTTYVLILPAITMDSETVCGIEAHTHGEDCYTQQPVTVFQCGLDGQTVVHTHEEICYDAQGALICPLPEIREHTHDESCYSRAETPACAYVHVHDAACTVLKELVCGLEEVEGHTHDSSCTGAESVLICETPEDETHTHTGSCYETREKVCQLEERAGHTHSAECYSEQAVVCELTTNDGHVHDESCYPVELVCGMEEVKCHTHDAACYDAENNLICTLPEVVAHTHTEACLVQTEEMQTVLSCNKEEHVHEDSCYAEEETDAPLEYICGSGVHTHVETCYNEAGECICTIPEHTHTAACVVEDLDLTADVETAQDWEADFAELTLTGCWPEDVLAVAQTQLGYQESEKNVVLEEGELKGYTRYGAWYGDPYGDWDAMFVSFCLEYAEITEEYIPYESDSARWVEALKKEGIYEDAAVCTPAEGDLMFLDTDEDGTVDRVGIVADLDDEDEIRIIAGDIRKDSVSYIAYERGDSTIAGYGKLPQNPLSIEQWQLAEEIAAQVANLPSAEDVREALQSLNNSGDKAGYEALRQELAARIESIREAYSTMNELQKARVGSVEILDALMEVCGGESWQQFPALTDDSAVVSGLEATGVAVISSAAGETDEAEKLVRNQDQLHYSFTIETKSYYTDLRFGEARVKVELVLPMAWGKAHFDTAAMPWLEDAVLKDEIRTINDAATSCQVLTGYLKLSADADSGIVVPGSAEETVVVKVENMAHGEKLAVIISAAMEHGTWNGVCQEHGVEEKRTIVTDTYTVYAPASAEEQQANYEAFLLLLEELEGTDIADSETLTKAMAFLNKFAEAYLSGAISEEQYVELSALVAEYTTGDVNSIAEPSDGNGWVWMDFDNVSYSTGSEVLTASSQLSSVPSAAAMPMALYTSLRLDSNSQIDRTGGGNASSDNAVYVSKTIEGTSQENVFDITLEIITRDEVNEVYKDPDMAVVIVMDISNTMTSVYSGESTVTRYDAAMTAATEFLQNFAEQNEGVSKVGYVAFNTHAHEVFAMQECSTTAQANTLASTMRTVTKNIMNKAAAATSDGLYKSSHDRFTNMEAGLKMAEDMLAGVDNEHKYIIFLTDGYPTTYLKSGYTGYDPYTSSGTKDTNGVFYDDVYNTYCSYGTSYSDTAAIRAREQAVSLKESGVNIFSIGVDVAGQSLWKYNYQSYVNRSGSGKFSVVERRREASYYETYGYEIGIYHGQISDTSLNTAQQNALAQELAVPFMNWLKGTSTTGIGSGYYYDSTDLSGLQAAYDQIFNQILTMIATSSHLDWVATDPMPDMGVYDVEGVEFIGFWDLDGNLQSSLSGVSKDGAEYENTATFDTETSTIHWDLKNSGYISMQMDNTTNYMCTLKYRVRLKNENDGFVENQIYDTNDVTSLTYRIIEVVDGEKTVSERRTVDFPIPAVHGYLSELKFMKTGPSGNPLVGAEFTLTHDTESCGTCRGDGVSNVYLEDMVAVSDANGMVTFTSIPSGHHYTLTETKVPEGYILNGNTYQVVISYDALTVTVTDANGNPLEWTETIKNNMYYALPNTGGMGTSYFTFGGLFMITAACVYYVNLFGRKRRKGGKYSKNNL